MDLSEKTRVRTNSWYRKFHKENTWTNYYIFALPAWGFPTGATIVLALWFKWASPFLWLLWLFPIWFAITTGVYLKQIDWRYPLTK